MLSLGEEMTCVSLKGLWIPSFYGGFQNNILALCVRYTHVLSDHVCPFLDDSLLAILHYLTRDARREEIFMVPMQKGVLTQRK